MKESFQRHAGHGTRRNMSLMELGQSRLPVLNYEPRPKRRWFRYPAAKWFCVTGGVLSGSLTILPPFGVWVLLKVEPMTTPWVVLLSVTVALLCAYSAIAT